MLKTSAEFDSAHFLAGYEGKCSNIHGHRWKIEVTVKSSELQKSGKKRGMIMDFADLKKAVRSVADHYDHALIVEKDTLKQKTKAALLEEGFRLIETPFRPTAENFAEAFYTILLGRNIPVSSVAVYETPENCAIFSGEV